MSLPGHAKKCVWNLHLCEEVVFNTCGECIKLYVWFYIFSSPLLFPDCDFIVYRSLNPIENQQTNIYAIVNSTYHFRGVQGNVCVKSTSLWGSRIWHLWGMYQNLRLILQFLITLLLFGLRLQSISFTESNRKPTNEHLCYRRLHMSLPGRAK